MKKIISYCIPVMNRSNDIKETLETNISVLKNFNNKVEIVINCFDEDSALSDWVEKNFEQYIESGLLTFNNMPKLEYWHFCWAKNSFKTKISSKYYASLDGDNYLTYEEVSNTIKLCEEKSNILIHLFSGKWGDGTSGRIIVPSELYKKFGYFDELFPRQFDEMALILCILAKVDVEFYSRCNVNIFELSGYAKKFKQKELKNSITHIEYDFGSFIPPLLPRGDGYANADKKLAIYQNINAYYSMSKVSNNDSSHKYFSDLLAQEQAKVISGDLSELIGTVLFTYPSRTPSKTNEITIFSVIKDDFQFLESWYHHYKNLGVKRFIIVDDNSSIPLSEKLCYDDVYVFKPKVGNFKLFKTFWIQSLAQLYQETDSWILTVDSDEYIDISSGSYNNISSVVNACEDNGKKVCGGLLIEMLPGNKTQINNSNFTELMNYHLWRPSNIEYGYQDIPSIRWGFGDNWSLSFEFDFRYRFYGTIDCLRKFPLIKLTNDLILNQGFHTVIYNKSQISSEEFNSTDLIKFPIKHYKFQKMVCDLEFERLLTTDISGYFGRTKNNIQKIIESDKSDTIDLFYNSYHRTKYDGSMIFKRLNA